MNKKSCCDICVPRVLCQVTSGSFKCGLKNRRFVQRKILLQYQVQMGIGPKLSI